MPKQRPHLNWSLFIEANQQHKELTDKERLFEKLFVTVAYVMRLLEESAARSQDGHDGFSEYVGNGLYIVGRATPTDLGIFSTEEESTVSCSFKQLIDTEGIHVIAPTVPLQRPALVELYIAALDKTIREMLKEKKQ